MKIYIIIILFFSLVTEAQNKENIWVVGVSGSLINFGDSNLNRLKEGVNFQAPKINITRYLFSGFSIDAGITLSALGDIDGFVSNSFTYSSFDGHVRYDFNLSDENLVPYVAFGASLVGPPSTIKGSKTTRVLNFGFGGTFWVLNNWGLNTQVNYKYSPEEYESMISHTQLTVGLVYSLNSRFPIKRFWDR